MKIKDIINEGGNVFTNKTAPIKRENILPTLDAYFSELKSLFPKKAEIFSTKYFILLGSGGKKEISNDLDLGVDSSSILDRTMSDNSIAEWGIDPANVELEFKYLQQRVRSSTPEQLKMKAFLKALTKYINLKSKNIGASEKKVTLGNIFTLFPQISKTDEEIEKGVQIDWMVGNLNWLKFSYYSAEYPPNSNVKGLHRTQLLLSAFHTANLSFDHTFGIKDKVTGKILASDPKMALQILSKRLKFPITLESIEDFYKLNTLLKTHMTSDQYRQTLDRYYKILDLTRIDIPDILQKDWLSQKNILGLTGNFLPNTSNLRRYM